MTLIAETATAENPQALQSPIVDCPECCASVALNPAPILHEILPCADCGAELEVIALSPLQVDLAPEVEEDWGE